MKKKTIKFQLKITLTGTKPLVWRRVIVDSDLLLEDMHSVIQSVMPWTDSHLHQFEQNYALYVSAEEVELDDFDLIDYSEIKLSDLIASEKDNLIYKYDFGDNWRHKIVIEKILPSTDSDIRAEYITGKNACPPEDCGGVHGYAHVLEVLKDPNDEEYHETREWLGLDDGEEYDPKCIPLDMEEVNDELIGLS